MSAGDDLKIALLVMMPPSRARRMVDAYAHELAEKIRNSKKLRDFTDDHMSDCNAAADLIDPGKQGT